MTLGDSWPTDDPACEPDPPIAGTITQLDNPPALGPRLVVEIEASKACYQLASGGAPWPTGLTECANEESGTP